MNSQFTSKVFYVLGRLLKSGRYKIFYILNSIILGRFKYLGKNIKFEDITRVDQWGRNIIINDNCLIGKNCYFNATQSGSIRIGKNVLINDLCYISSCESITIGDNTMIAEMVGIRDFDHRFSEINIPIFAQGLVASSISIEPNCWICRGVTITKGVTIGEGSIIGANSVVTKNIPAFSLAVGQPAKVIKNLK